MKGKLSVYQSCCAPHLWCWEIVAGRVYITSCAPVEFASKAGALKSAKRAAERLGIEIINQKEK